MVALALVVLVASTGEAQTKRKLSMGTATIGGLYYIYGGAWAKVLNEAVPEVEITAESTPGSVANAQMIQAGKIAIGFSQATAAYESYNGLGWTKGTKYDKLRALVALYPAALTVYTLESRNIRTLKDLNDKNVSLGPAGAGVDQFGRNLFEVLGIKPKRIHNLPHEQTAKAVGDGQLDAGMTVQLAPWPGLKDLETSAKLVFLPVSKEDGEKVRAKYPYYAEGFLPKGSYKAITADIPSLGDWNLGIVGADMSDDLAYKLAKGTFAKQKDLLATHRAAEYTIPQNAKWNTIPIHPGAVRFYKEAGVEIPAALLPK
jgi:TRAP transporter TAXI family solute receptor